MGKQSTRIATALAASLLWLVTGAAPRAAELNSGYIVTNQGALGITRAFDDGQNTVLAFVDLDNQTPQLSGGDGQKIKFRQVDNYAVLPGKFDEVRVTTAGNNSGVVRSAAIQAPATAVAVAPVAALAVMPVASAATASADVALGTSATGASNGVVAKPSAQTMAFSGDMPVTNTATAGPSPKSGAGSARTIVAIAPAAAPVAAPERPAPPKPAWQGKAPTDAKIMLLAWAVKAHWTAIWDAGFTFPIKSDIDYDGTFEQAVGAHYMAYTDRRRTKTPVCVDLHRSNKTVHVYQPDDSGKCDALLSSATATTPTETKVTP
jgi:hypothetical protein